MTRDFVGFPASLNSEGAAYVVIGGMAVVFYVPYRTTRDIDVLIERAIPQIYVIGGADTRIRAWS